MLPLEHPDRIQSSFDDHRLVANAGLLLPVTLAQHLGLRELVQQRTSTWADAPEPGEHGRQDDDPGGVCAGGRRLHSTTPMCCALAGTARTLGGTVKAPSTLGTFLRSFRWGHVRQLDRVSRELLARAWAAGAGPGDGTLTIDLDSTICETYGLAKEGAPATMATPASGAITRCRPSPPKPAEVRPSRPFQRHSLADAATQSAAVGGIMAQKLVYATAGEPMAELPAMPELALAGVEPRC